MGKNRTPEQSQEKFNKSMQTFTHLNRLRGEIIKRIDSDPHIAFKEMDDKSKSKELLNYFRPIRWAFYENLTVDYIITHLKENIKKIDFLK